MANRFNWTDVRSDYGAGEASALQSAKMKYNMSTDGLSKVLNNYVNKNERLSDANIASESAGNTASIIEQIRAGKTPERSGYYNNQKIADAGYEYEKYKTAQAFKQRAEARAIAAAGRSAAAHKARMKGLTGTGTGSIGGSGGSLDWGTALDNALAPKTTEPAPSAGLSNDEMIKNIMNDTVPTVNSSYPVSSIENFIPDTSGIATGTAGIVDTSVLDNMVDPGAVPTTIAQDNTAAAQEALLFNDEAAATVARDDAFSRVMKNRNSTPAESYLSEDNGMLLPMRGQKAPVVEDPNAENAMMNAEDSLLAKKIEERDANFRSLMPEGPTGDYPEVPYTGSTDQRTEQMARELGLDMGAGPDNYDAVDPYPDGEADFLKRIADNQSRKDFRDSLPADLKKSFNLESAPEGDLYKDTESLLPPTLEGDDIPGKMLENKIAKETRAEAKIESDKNVANAKAMAEFKKTIAENKKRTDSYKPEVKAEKDAKAEETLVKKVKEASVKAVKSTNISNLNTFMSGQKLVKKAEDENKQLAAKGKPKKQLDPYLQTIKEYGERIKKTNDDYNKEKASIAEFEKQGRALINKKMPYDGTKQSKWRRDNQFKQLDNAIKSKKELVDERYSTAVKANEAEKAGFAVMKEQYDQRMKTSNKKSEQKEELNDFNLLAKNGTKVKPDSLKTIAGKKKLLELQNKKKTAKKASKAGGRKALYENLSGLGGSERINVDRIVKSLDSAGIKGAGDAYLRYTDEWMPNGAFYGIAGLELVSDAPDNKEAAKKQLKMFMKQNEYTTEQQDKALEMFDKDNE